MDLLDLSLEAGEVQVVAHLTVEALLDQLVPAAALTEGGVPATATAVAPGWQTVEIRGRTFRVLAYRARLAGIGAVQLVIAQKWYWEGGWSPYVPMVTHRAARESSGWSRQDIRRSV